MSAVKRKIIVTGASGHLGGEVVRLLEERDGLALIAGTRTPATLSGAFGGSVEIRRVDFDAPGTLEQAFDGIERALVVSTDKLDEPGRRRRQHQNALDALVKAGVRHVSYTSMPKPGPASPIAFAPDHVAMERALAASGLEYAVLRNSWYMEDLLLILPYVIASGTWYTSAANGRAAYVARSDTAAAAAGALSQAGGRMTHEVTGPELHTVDDLAGIAGEVVGRPIRVVQVSDERLARELTAQGVPDFYVPMAVMTDQNQRSGGFDVLTDAVRELSGRAPESLDSFLRRHRGLLLARI